MSSGDIREETHQSRTAMHFPLKYVTILVCIGTVNDIRYLKAKWRIKKFPSLTQPVLGSLMGYGNQTELQAIAVVKYQS